MSNYGYDFLLAEYNNLKAEILSINNEIRHLFELSITMSSIFWAWVLGQKDRRFFSPPLKYFSSLPLCICVIVGLFIWALYRDIMNVGAYIQKTEQLLLG